jgi:hypothetical protein
MNKKIFRNFYEVTIRKIANTICETNENFSFVDNFDGLFAEYLNQKTLLKFIFEKNDLLDRHKISACITVALMRIRLLYDRNIDDIDNNYSLTTSSRMNEQLAFLSGLDVLVSYIKTDDKTDDRVKEYLKNGIFCFPKTNYPEKSEYLDSIIRALYYSNTLSGFQTLLISNIFFLLEKYNEKCCLSNAVEPVANDGLGNKR